MDKDPATTLLGLLVLLLLLAVVALLLRVNRIESKVDSNRTLIQNQSQVCAPSPLDPLRPFSY